MLHNTQALYGHKLTASDGDIGHVQDFYFDDKSWVIRYLIADTGTWLAGRLVLLTPHSFGKLDDEAKTLQVKLRKNQIEKSPSIETHKPVSRQYEADYYRYYGWPAYWDGDAMWGLGGSPVVLALTREEMEADQRHHHRDDKHLQSTHAVKGYEIQATDGPIGSVSGFMVDDRNWAIRDLVVETGHWYAGKQILIAVGKVVRVSYEESKVFVNLTKVDIERTGENKVAKAGAASL